MNYKHKKGQENIIIILAAMPGTQAQLAKKTGLAGSIVARWCRRLEVENKAHISDWYDVPHGGKQRAIYHAGPGVRACKRVRPVRDVERVRPVLGVPKPHAITVALYGMVA